MRTLNEIRATAIEMNIGICELAKASGMSVDTTFQVLRGNRVPLLTTVEALSNGVDVVIEQRKEAGRQIRENGKAGGAVDSCPDGEHCGESVHATQG